jgi:hypothetical protein
VSDYMPPTAGPASDEYRAVCVYIHRHGGPQCDAPATVHVMSDTEQYGVVGFAACDVHARIARAAGRFVMEHPHAGYCGLPGTIWHLELNVCVLDDSGEEPLLTAALEAVAS